MKIPGKPLLLNPTRFGWVYLAFVMLSLLGCINYQLSLGYLLCFLLASTWLVCLVEAYRHLQGLTVTFHAPDAVFAGQESLLEVQVTNHQNQPRADLEVQLADQTHLLSIPPLGEATASLLVPTHQRGWQPAPEVTLQGRDLLGLFRVRQQVPGEARVMLVYPALEERPPVWRVTGEATGTARRKTGQEEYSGLRSYQTGDTLGRVAWKRGELPDGTLLTKEFESHQDVSVVLSFQQLPAGLNTEQKLSRLAAWVVQAQKLGIHYKMVLPGFEASGAGERHTQRCLTRLAEFPGDRT
ncbi:DUF58 domain-containing protein [Deinococcus cellulosilyticus]|uniref:Uncharacterized protein n=1 Tax=Deinococcus cellulosilyticus (strain DSM 18568 / NBRC 106333 / KACC 11606 / 5516J-15) TaxID=1223518 RepID=A0A511MWI6_DEIC1|nr:DUF58 domain-containing protein [Deinococcus cellulosilyticus]GEM44751.1 hypothetical protein DC3_03860 [Deinococcus cellulosilyticus NBRC 106333 = KACC 11606]